MFRRCGGGGATGHYAPHPAQGPLADTQLALNWNRNGCPTAAQLTLRYDGGAKGHLTQRELAALLSEVLNAEKKNGHWSSYMWKLESDGHTDKEHCVSLYLAELYGDEHEEQNLPKGVRRVNGTLSEGGSTVSRVFFPHGFEVLCQHIHEKVRTM
jgi:hypothetical protein